MLHSDDAYAAMLLTMALAPNKEESVRPCSVQEFRQIEAKARDSQFRRVGRLMGVDISGLMIHLGLSEEEAYRLYLLLNRSVQLSYALDGFAREGIEVVTLYDEEYPERLRRKLTDASPPFLYRCGEAALLNRPAVAVMGISGVKTTQEVRKAVEALVKWASGQGYAVLTGGEPGVSRLVEGLAEQYRCPLVSVLGGALSENVRGSDTAEGIAAGLRVALSLEHPEAMFTASHAIARNKVMFALAEAAFVFNTDGKRGEIDALRNGVCDWIYAWEGWEGNRALLQRGARPIRMLDEAMLDEMSERWRSSRAEQMSLFDYLQ